MAQWDPRGTLVHHVKDCRRRHCEGISKHLITQKLGLPIRGEACLPAQEQSTVQQCMWLPAPGSPCRTLRCHKLSLMAASRGDLRCVHCTVVEPGRAMCPTHTAIELQKHEWKCSTTASVEAVAPALCQDGVCPEARSPGTRWRLWVLGTRWRRWVLSTRWWLWAIGTAAAGPW